MAKGGQKAAAKPAGGRRAMTLKEVEALRERLGQKELLRRQEVCARLGGHRWVTTTSNAPQKYCVLCLVCPFLDGAPS